MLHRCYIKSMVSWQKLHLFYSFDSTLTLKVAHRISSFNNIRYSVTASTVRFHRADPGSTPGIGIFFSITCNDLQEVDIFQVLHFHSKLKLIGPRNSLDSTPQSKPGVNFSQIDSIHTFETPSPCLYYGSLASSSTMLLGSMLCQKSVTIATFLLF